jgi:hypothetical protein
MEAGTAAFHDLYTQAFLRGVGLVLEENMQSPDSVVRNVNHTPKATTPPFQVNRLTG